MGKYGVKGFPTILVFGVDKSNPSPYEGGRVASEIESFALRQLDVATPEVVELTGQVRQNFFVIVFHQELYLCAVGAAVFFPPI